jgi:beta-lactamase class A
LADLLSLPQAQAWVRERLPRSVVVAHKSGQLPGVRHEAAVLSAPRGPIVVVGLTSDLADQDAAESFLARLGKEVYDHLAEPPPR